MNKLVLGGAIPAILSGWSVFSYAVADTALSGLPAPADPPLLRMTAPPWPRPSAELAYIEAARLPLYRTEKVTVHYHAHLDVLINGTAVTVPSGLGITHDRISPLHTHDRSGLLHVESATKRIYTLGQLFTEWGVRLTNECLGGYCNHGNIALQVYVHGKPFAGDPRQLRLKSHQEIAVVYGDAADQADPPRSYDFAVGD